MAKAKNIALTGGATGGHIYPCLAVAEAIIEEKPRSKLFYIGHQDKLEAELLNNEDLTDGQNRAYSNYIKFLGLEAEPLPRSKNPLAYLSFVWKFWSSVQLASRYLKENKIDVVFGTGGYVAGPAFAAAILNKIPYIIHNLDAHMGLANRFFVKDAAVLTLGFPDLEDLRSEVKSGKVEHTGNPVSSKFISVIASDSEAIQTGSPRRFAPRDDNRKIKLLITGGSQGAQSINEAIASILPQLADNPQLNIIHVTGAKLYDDYVEKHLDGKADKYSNYKVIAYTHQMPKLCANADIAICRSGAMTIAEMVASQVVPIFIPLPWAAHDHQTLNAQSLVNESAAIMIKQNDPEFAQRILDCLNKLIGDREMLQYMQNKLADLAKPDAANKLAELVLGLK
ncbi:MAG: UDP-N-acetylglucosamine--N-acetylmuramyl-(pentapeptide) pyrophosphoryl-undecaprenol N-acetylglucosamine transferase [Candidatus Melainabacteria bacterium]|nr:UDP-N-acetylglucosamine--N-acetylmuramyl-(pentapeptide) pyrophosphoryl-undecaprenol N-acetylglucosamine transferase [Candidatus Melainabacteria bacterium]